MKTSKDGKMDIYQVLVGAGLDAELVCDGAFIPNGKVCYICEKNNSYEINFSILCDKTLFEKCCDDLEKFLTETMEISLKSMLCDKSIVGKLYIADYKFNI